MTVVGKKKDNILTWIHLIEDEEKQEINRLCSSQGFEVLARGKPANYTIADGYLEFNINDMVLVIE